SWIGKLVMYANGGAEDKQRGERNASGKIAEQLSTGQAREHRVIKNVCGKQPEIDQRMTKEPEKRAGKDNIYSGSPTERPRQQLNEDFVSHGQGGDLPNSKCGVHSDDAQRRFLSGMRFAPAEVNGNPGVESDPGADDKNGQAGVEDGMRF